MQNKQNPNMDKISHLSEKKKKNQCVSLLHFGSFIIIIFQFYYSVSTRLCCQQIEIYSGINI